MRKSSTSSTGSRRDEAAVKYTEVRGTADTTDQ
jgi:hypothetical protein